MNKFFTIGAVAGRLLVSMISSKLQPVFSLATILSVFIGGIIGVIVGFALGGAQSPQNKDKAD